MEDLKQQIVQFKEAIKMLEIALSIVEKEQIVIAEGKDVLRCHNFLAQSIHYHKAELAKREADLKSLEETK